MAIIQNVPFSATTVEQQPNERKEVCGWGGGGGVGTCQKFSVTAGLPCGLAPVYTTPTTISIIQSMMIKLLSSGGLGGRSGGAVSLLLNFASRQ